MKRMLFVALILTYATSAGAQDLVLTNVNIVDPAARTVSRGSLWIEAGKIVGRGEAAPASARGERIDATGKWVIPGLVDLHTHSGLNQVAGAVDAIGTQAMAG